MEIQKQETIVKKILILTNMPATLNLQDILSNIQKLDKAQQFTLLEKLVAIIRKDDTTKKPVNLSNISGIGSKVWQSSNIDEYIDKERQW
jgi:hypothetical protein